MKRENLKLKSNKYRNQINTVKSCKTDVSSVSPLTKDLSSKREPRYFVTVKVI